MISTAIVMSYHEGVSKKTGNDYKIAELFLLKELAAVKSFDISPDMPTPEKGKTVEVEISQKDFTKPPKITVLRIAPVQVKL